MRAISLQLQFLVSVPQEFGKDWPCGSREVNTQPKQIHCNMPLATQVCNNLKNTFCKKKKLKNKKKTPYGVHLYMCE